MSSTTTVPSSWSDIQSLVGETPVGKALNNEASLRKMGLGSAHVHNTLRLFDSTNEDGKNDNGEPAITLYRDYAGWCPYWYDQISLFFGWLLCTSRLFG